MHNIKLIKREPSLYVKKFSERNTIFDLKNILELDTKNRDFIHRLFQNELLTAILSKYAIIQQQLQQLATQTIT